MDDTEYARRFGSVGRLLSSPAQERLRRAHVMVAGVGGIGSWTVEALARSGVGKLTSVDLDDVRVSNVNRQVQALDGAIGRPKVEVMAERARAIRPAVEVGGMAAFYTEH